MITGPNYLHNLLVYVRRMASSGMLRRVALVKTEFSEDRNVSFIRVTRIDELGKLSVTRNRRTLRRNTKSLCNFSQRASVASYGYRYLLTDSCHPDEGGAKFLRNVGSYKSRTA
jgi:hypothetical protein